MPTKGVAVRFERYCLGDREFFTEPSVHNSPAPRSLDLDYSDYHLDIDGFWTHLLPKAARRPDIQGWKIHLSSELGEELRVIRTAAGICDDMKIPFKYVSSIRAYRLANSKNADRTASGKLVTIYPCADDLEAVLDRLEEGLAGTAGPHILTDVRWKRGPVFVRFGAFKRIEQDGKFCVRRPDGTLEEDLRRPWFNLPDWVVVPEFLQPAIARTETHDVPFRVDSVVRQSNSGGVYRAEMIDGREAVILKEGRRYAGYTRDGADGYHRVRYEARILSRLNGSACSPRVLWESDLSGHYMMVMSAMPGITLQRWTVQRMPVYSLSGTDWQEYALACEQVIARLTAAVDRIEAAGLTHGDIHPQNILVDPETLDIGLVDFETTTIHGDTPTREINAPGYRIPGDLAPEHIDRFAITKVIADMLTGTVEHEDITDSQYNGALPVLLDRLAAENGAVPPALRRLVALRAKLLETFGIEGDIVDPIPRGQFIARLRADLPAVLTVARNRIGHLPVHFDAFEDELGGLGLGMAGHAYALGTSDRAALITDILAEARRTDRAGLFDGVCGSVYSLLALGAETEAVAALEGRYLLREAPGPRIFDGVAGILLAAINAESRPAVAKLLSNDLEGDIGNFARRYLAQPEAFRTTHDLRTNNLVLQRSGLMYGDLGYAWLFAAASRRFHDPLFVEAMNSALRAELRNYTCHPTGGLQYEDDGRLLPYLATGSAGFGVVLQSVDKELLDPAVTAALGDLLTACAPAFSVGGGLFNGYAGLFYGANGLRRFMGLDEAPLAELDAAVSGLGVRTSFDAWAVPGDGNFRLTTDLATGSSGIIHVANMIEAGDYRLLPPLQT